MTSDAKTRSSVEGGDVKHARKYTLHSWRTYTNVRACPQTRAQDKLWEMLLGSKYVGGRLGADTDQANANSGVSRS
jgi:hypothetical protein